MAFAAIHQYADETAACFAGRPALQKLFRNCFLNTLETTLQQGDGDAFVVTGDIPAMWLRDSSAQVRHYLPVAATDEETARMIASLVRRQWACILTDPYANAFNKSPNGAGHRDDRTAQNPWVWERKYEVDSLCYPLDLAWRYWKATGNTDVFGGQFRAAAETILCLWEAEQDHTTSPYTFERTGCPPGDTLPNGGRGTPVARTGMTWSGFRPSDDACRYGYLVPANMFAVVALHGLCEIARIVCADEALALRAQRLSGQIDEGIRRYGVVEHPAFGSIYAYETDGLGNHNLMDDANVPSLLAAPYLGYCAPNDPLYLATRRFVLSATNPFYFSGAAARGVGSPHTPAGYVWHIALAVQGLTGDAGEAAAMLEALLATDAGTGFLHESFDANDPRNFTRPWFAWANSICAELMVRCAGKRDHAKKGRRNG